MAPVVVWWLGFVAICLGLPALLIGIAVGAGQYIAQGEEEPTR